MNEWENEEELSDQDLKFLEQWENMGKGLKEDDKGAHETGLMDEDERQDAIESGGGFDDGLDDGEPGELKSGDGEAVEGDSELGLAGEEGQGDGGTREKSEGDADDEEPEDGSGQGSEGSEGDEAEDEGSESEGESEQESEKESGSGEEDSSGLDDEEESEQDDQQQGEDGDLPERPEGCENHCEDNSEDDEGESCPHCNERIRREREQWGVIATDMKGKDIRPGDKVAVRIPISFIQEDVVLTANVPNLEEKRVAEHTSGAQDDSLLWLSGSAISPLTGWHMQGDGPIWTFPQHKQLPFVEKVAEWGMPKDDQQSGGNNFDDLDMSEFDDREEEKELRDDQGRHLQQGRDQKKDNGKPLTETQKGRFDNIFMRINRKAQATFGDTAEAWKVGEQIDRKEHLARAITVTSRGMKYRIIIQANRTDSEKEN